MVERATQIITTQQNRKMSSTVLLERQQLSLNFTKDDFDVSLVQMPTARKKDRSGQARHLDEEELLLIFDLLPTDKWKVIFAIAYFCGARIGEVLALGVNDVERDRVVFRAETTKTDKRREAHIVPALRRTLDDWQTMPKAGLMFPGRTTKRTPHPGPISRQAADKVLREVCNCLGIDGASTHSFRRSFATNLARSGKSLAVIKRLLGHADVDTTKVYVG